MRVVKHSTRELFTRQHLQLGAAVIYDHFISFPILILHLFCSFFSLSCLHWHLGALGLCWVAPFSTGLLFVRLSAVLEQFQSDYLAFNRFASVWGQCNSYWWLQSPCNGIQCTSGAGGEQFRSNFRRQRFTVATPVIGSTALIDHTIISGSTSLLFSIFFTLKEPFADVSKNTIFPSTGRIRSGGKNAATGPNCRFN